jgi:predicted nucleotidyltransferase component of viral defense system
MVLQIDRHKNVLIGILKDIYTDNTIGPILGLEGGTAAYLFYELDRFSVDLDFDLIDLDKEEYVFERIERILTFYGKIKTKRRKHFTLFFELSYGDEDHNIKVEVNRRSFGSAYEVASYFGISMKVMTREDMFANKIVAMYERLGRTNRDIYDVWFFYQKNWPINKAIVEQRTKMTFREFLTTCIEMLEKIPDRTILAGMGELLDVKQKTWVKAKLKTETLFFLKVMLGDEK